MNSRIKRVRKKLIEKKIDAILVSQPANIFYLSTYKSIDLTSREAFLLVTKRCVCFFVYSLVLENAKKLKGDFKIFELNQNKSLISYLNGIIKKENLQSIGFEPEDLKFFEYKTLKSELMPIELVETEDLIKNLRVIKDYAEIKAIEKACEITDKAFTNILRFIKPNKTEKEIAKILKYFLMENCDGPSFEPIVASGVNSAIPHYATGRRRFKKNDIILLDFGARVDNYCADMTRSVFLGKAAQEQKRIYKLIIETRKKALDYLRFQITNFKFQKNSRSQISKDIKAKEVNNIAQEFLKRKGFSFLHGLGHGIGLSVHEKPSLSIKSTDILKPNMVFSIEPGIYISGKFGIRLEDLVLLKNKSIKVLTSSSLDIFQL